MSAEHATPETSTRTLWLIAAAVLPLFGVHFLRVPVSASGGGVALPALLLIAAVVVSLRGHGPGFLAPLTRGSHRRMAAAAAVFLLINAFGALRAPDPSAAARIALQLAAGMVIMAGAALLFPAAPAFLERFWSVAVLGSTALSVFLLHRYAWMFRVPFLGTDLSAPDFHDRNHLAGSLVYMFPFAFSACFARPARWQSYPACAILAATLVYTGSRTGLLAAALGAALILTSARSWLSLPRLTRTTAGLILLIALTLGSLHLRVGPLDVYRRVQYLYNPQSVPELNSYGNRAMLVRHSLACTAPHRWTGLGLGQSPTCRRGMGPHNDFVSVLGDLGVPGLVSLLVLLGLAVWKAFLRPPLILVSRPWLLAGTRASFLSACLMLNTMDGIHRMAMFWLVFGMIYLRDASEEAP